MAALPGNAHVADQFDLLADLLELDGVPGLEGFLAKAFTPAHAKWRAVLENPAPAADIARLAKAVTEDPFALLCVMRAVRPDVVVIACNTASTLVLPELRAAHSDVPFVGTVPAVKPAAARSHSRLISVLATPATVARDYTHDLIRQHAAHCEVTLVGSARLAPLAEAFMKGEPVSDDEIASEIAPCFVERDGRRTDHVVLACTHYPLLLDRLRRVSPWRVEWVDPAHAIARRVDHVLAEADFPHEAHVEKISAGRGTAHFTSGQPPDGALATALGERGLTWDIAAAVSPFDTIV